jgi:hypothetical protein
VRDRLTDVANAILRVLHCLGDTIWHGLRHAARSSHERDDRLVNRYRADEEREASDEDLPGRTSRSTV